MSLSSIGGGDVVATAATDGIVMPSSHALLGVDNAGPSMAVADNQTMNDMEHSRLTIGIYVTLYTLIFIIGITGNSLVVYVVCAKKSMQSVTNLFILNLALSDLLMCLLAVPFTPISFFSDTW